MSIDAQSSLYTPDPAADAEIATALAGIAAPGSFFTGAERIAFANQARFARGLIADGPTLDPLVAESVSRVAVEAMNSRFAHVAAWEASGRDVVGFVEMVAVVALTCSIDAYRIGLGAPLDALPEPQPGDPTPAVDERAVTSNAWVPTVGVALAPTSLSALPNEGKRKGAISKAWYLTDEFVHKYDVEPGRELTRGQMELIASRTSYLNECFF